MSTVLYEALTNAREATKPASALEVAATNKDDEAISKDVPKLVDTVAALVPVEVLAAHAALQGAVSQASDPAGKGPVQVIITDEAWAHRFWYLLILAAIALYAVPHFVKHGWDRWDFLRAAIPAGAFVAWTMLQKATLFDAVADWSNLARIGIGTGIALLALTFSKALADTAQEKNPGDAQAATLS